MEFYRYKGYLESNLRKAVNKMSNEEKKIYTN
jgi:hypothetical protein